ncbi:MAG: hypothetical protein AAGU19_17270 [Prolixibacteraceae bacterium]
MNKTLIYTEGGFYLGLGNVYRMIELAKSLKGRLPEIQITFVTSSEEYVNRLFETEGFKVISVQKQALIDTIVNEDFKLLIIDKLDIEQEFLNKIKLSKKNSFKVVLFGNLSFANNISDLVINAIVGTDFSNKSYIDEYGTRYLTGPRYLTLREEFTYRSYIHKYDCRNILLLFGGTDQSNYSCKATEKLLNHSSAYNITLVLGKGFQFLNELELKVSYAPNVKILMDIKNVQEVMLENDFLLTSPGTALFEGLYLGLPCLAFFQNESQKKVFRNFVTTRSFEEIDLIDEIKATYYHYEDYQDRIAKLAIGQGKYEIINHIIDLL